MPRGPEFERVSTTLVNAYVAPRIATYTQNLQDKLRARRLRRAAADHAVDRRRDAARLRRAARGHAARERARPAASWAPPSRPRAAGIGDFVAVDMGGTSFDICLVRDGRPEIKTDWNWRYRYYIGLPMVDVQSVGAGGGSIARVRQGALLVGPESAGSVARPGVLRPGRHPSDRHRRRRGARLPPRRRLRRRPHAPRRRRGARRDHAPRRRTARHRRHRGRVGHRAHRERQHGERDPQGARRARRRPARPLADRVRRQRRGARVRRSPASSASAASSCPRPRPRSARSACSSPTTSSTSCAPTSLRCRRSTSVGSATSSPTCCKRSPRSSIPPGVAPADVETNLFAQMCYPGQNFDMSVPVPEGVALDEPGLLDLAERFHDQHETRARVLLPLPAAADARRARRSRGAPRRSPTTSRRPGPFPTPIKLGAAPDPRSGATGSSTRRCTTEPGSGSARPSPGPRSSRSRSPSWCSRPTRPRPSTISATTLFRCDARAPARLPFPLGPGVVPHVRRVPRPARRRGRRGARSARYRPGLQVRARRAGDRARRLPRGAARTAGRARRRAARGRLAAGPWYVQPDSLLPAGETHVRNLLLGRQVAGALGPVSTVGYVPDSFGHPAQLPQLLAGFGLDPLRLLARQRRRARHARTAVPLVRARRFVGAGLAASRGLLRGRGTRRRPRPRGHDRAAAGSDRTDRQGRGRAGAVDERLRPSPGRHVDRARRRARCPPSACCSTRPRPGCPTRRRSPSFSGELVGARTANLLPGVWSARMPLKLRNRAVETLLTDWLEPWAAFGRALGRHRRTAVDRAGVAITVVQPGARLDLRLLDRPRARAHGRPLRRRRRARRRDTAAGARTARGRWTSRATRRGRSSRTSSCSTPRRLRAPMSCAFHSKAFPPWRASVTRFDMHPLLFPSFSRRHRRRATGAARAERRSEPGALPARARWFRRRVRRRRRSRFRHAPVPGGTRRAVGRRGRRRPRDRSGRRPGRGRRRLDPVGHARCATRITVCSGSRTRSTAAIPTTAIPIPCATSASASSRSSAPGTRRGCRG